MKKFLDWCKKHKFPLLLGALALLVICVLYVTFQAFKKDHSLDMALQKLELKEESRVASERERQAWIKILDGMNDNFKSIIARDSVVSMSILDINERINQLKISTQYHEKIKVIDTYSDDQLREYFRDLPRLSDNEY